MKNWILLCQFGCLVEENELHEFRDRFEAINYLAKCVPPSESEYEYSLFKRTDNGIALRSWWTENDESEPGPWKREE